MEEQIIRTEYSDLMQKSYIDYAMSVIIARALPDVRDGLKPVQRRTTKKQKILTKRQSVNENVCRQSIDKRVRVIAYMSA